MQACCINFNNSIKELLGARFGLEDRLSFALQFVSFGEDQRDLMKHKNDLPAHIASFIGDFEKSLTNEQIVDHAFRYRVAFIPVTNNRSSGADRAIEFVKPGSDEALAFEKIYLKEVDRPRYTATKVANYVQKNGYPLFKENPNHRDLVKMFDAKNPKKGYSKKGDYKETWVYNKKWVEKVIEHCSECGDKFKALN